MPELHDILQGKQASQLAYASQQPPGLSMAGAVRIVQYPLTVPRLMNMLPTCSTRVFGRQQAMNKIKGNFMLA